MDDKENVRVDLLKFRRKAFMSYPEGSNERRNFLKTILQNELRLTEKEVPLELINYIIEGDNVAIHDTIKDVALCSIAAITCGVAAFMFRSLFHGIATSIFIGGSFGCLWAAYQYGYDYFLFRKSVDTVKQYSNDMKKYMNKISNDIKRLEGPNL